MIATCQKDCFDGKQLFKAGEQYDIPEGSPMSKYFKMPKKQPDLIDQEPDSLNPPDRPAGRRKAK